MEEFMENGKRLEKNRNGGEGTVLSGAAREGLALLQGLLLCGNCGRALGVRYLGNGGIYPQYLCNWLRREGLAAKSCMQVRCDVLDAAISEEVGGSTEGIAARGTRARTSRTTRTGSAR